MTLPPRLALVGFMGSGKSTVGRILAERTGYDFVDADDAIEHETRATVQDVFRAQGEPAFRALESSAIRNLLTRNRLVLATGGGAFAQDALAEDIMARSFVIHLHCDFEEAFKRASRQGGRPLVEKGENEAEMLYAGRKAKYARAHVTVDTTNRSPADVVKDILDAVQLTQG